ncbi:MAG: ABC transporter ATP-binding protein [Erysipelotrichaceae bacterium]
MSIIETKQLTKYYGKARGIIEVDLAIEEGEIFGFIGPNGAGKSTTIRLLLSLIKPTSGKASIFGLDCEHNYQKIHEEIGYLPSEVFYYDNMKVKDLLAYSASFYRKDCKQRIIDLSKRLDLDLNRKIHDLSYGNKKKVGIVQGLLHSPKIIILDEPTGGLDPLMQQTFFDIILEENKRGATVLFSSHILSEVQRLCDRIAIIKDGKIIRIDTIASLKENTYLKVELETTSLPKEFKDNHMDNFKDKDGQVSFLYRGNVNELLKQLSGLTLSRLSLTEPDLEEIFLHYYEKE